MAKFNSKPITVDAPAEKIFDKFNDLSLLHHQLNQLPAEAREKIGNVSFEKESITILTPQVGEIKFVVRERKAPEKIVFGTESSPVPLTLTAFLTPLGADKTEIMAETDVDIPAMLKPMVSGPMQKATDQFASLIARLASVSKE